MRRLLTFDCEGASLGATLDEGGGDAGLLFVTGGSQTRVGSHRMSERLAIALAAQGYSSFRCDRRGVGDSEAEDPGWRGSAPDIAAAVAAFREASPGTRRIFGFGLCDGASALALFGAQAGLDGLILTNPWLIEMEADAPPPAAIRDHYKRQLLSLGGWRKLLSGAVSYRKILSGLGRIAAPPPAGLAGEIAASLEKGGLPVELILARNDGTALGAADAWSSGTFRSIREANPPPHIIESGSHTFAREGDEEALLAACLAALGRLSGRG
jgi:exosortase A-associated hydrolase 1